MAARVPSRVCGNAAERHLLLLILCGALFFGASGLSSYSSVRLLAEDFNEIDHHSGYPLVNHGRWRHLLQDTSNSSDAPDKLATSRTDRPNPLDGLKTYRGGYDLKSRDYGASVAYTGLPAYILTILWVALGLLLLLSLLIACCCCRNRAKPEYDHGRLGYIIPLLALILFTIAAIVGSALLYYAQRKFNQELNGTLDYVVNQSESTQAGLRQVASNLTNAASVNVEGFFTLSDADKAQIRTLSAEITNAADNLNNKTVDNRKDIKDGINIVRIVLIVVAAVMLALVLLGLLFSACGIRSIVYLLAFIGWILVTGTWILCGIFILLDNGIGDTCLAMQEWVASPQANTTLDRLLPCVDQSTANSALLNSRVYESKIVGLVNQGIDTVVNQNYPPGTPTYYNQSGPLVPNLCDIYGPAPDYPPVSCPSGTVNFSEAASTWQEFVCTVDANQICVTQGRLTPSYYSQLTSAATIGGNLASNADFLASTANCTFVRDVFTNIQEDRCHNLRKHAKWIWIGLVLVSSGAMLSVLSWLVYIRRRKYRYKGGQQQPMYKGQSQQYSPTPPPASPAA